MRRIKRLLPVLLFALSIVSTAFAQTESTENSETKTDSSETISKIRSSLEKIKKQMTETESTQSDMEKANTVLNADVANIQPETAAQSGGVTPTDVYKAVAIIRADLELIRSRQNKTKNTQPEFPVRNASPMEVFSQAETLQRKTEQLYFEQSGSHETIEVLLPEGNVRPQHVLAIVNNAKKHVQQIKEQLNIKDTNKVNTSVSPKTPTDAFKSIIQTNRQLNLMLEQKVVPSDVFQRVEESINYLYVLRQQFPGARMPSMKRLQEGKTPADVYNRLINCFRIQRKIMISSGFSTLNIDSGHSAGSNTTPGEVYDITSLVLAEISQAYFTLKNRQLTPGVFYPGLKTPSQVYQLIGVLESQLTELLPLVTRDTNWLRRSSTQVAVSQ